MLNLISKFKISAVLGVICGGLLFYSVHANHVIEDTKEQLRVEQVRADSLGELLKKEQEITKLISKQNTQANKQLKEKEIRINELSKQDKCANSIVPAVLVDELRK